MSPDADNPVHQLIYLSSAVGEIGTADLDSILTASRRNNQAAGVTGLLLFHDGCFFQVLEGPRPEVHRVFAQIRTDPRHTGSITLQDRACDRRAFADWSMGFVGSSQLALNQRAALIDLSMLLDADHRPDFSSAPHVTRQINAFLDTFREFALP